MRVRTNRAGLALDLVVTVALAVLMVALSVASASAQECSGEGSIRDRGGDVVGECLIGEPGTPGSAGVGALWGRYCSEAGPYREGYEVRFHLFAPVSEEEVELFGLDPTGVYVWYEVTCVQDGHGGVEYPILVEESPPVPPVVIRDEAAARIEPPAPSPELSPPLVRQAIVAAPTWLWLDSSYWVPLEASETRGVTTVGVRATPVHANWVMGDGGGVVCYGPGVVWAPGLPEDATDCSYTFEHSSYGTSTGRFAASVTVRWEFEWWISGVYQGAFGTVDLSAPFEIAVGEIQAVETGG